MPEVLENIGAGEGNRTLVFSLEGCCSTIELHPLIDRSPITPGKAPQPLCAGSDPKAPLFPRPYPLPLTGADSMPILMFPSTTKGGDPVSYTKRCHLAGIAR